ncbi:hypothetical protein WA158_006713 [Blastocystis sp. Blastoise]
MLLKQEDINYILHPFIDSGQVICDMGEVLPMVSTIQTTEEWLKEWKKLAQNALRQNRYLHAGYYFKMAQTFLDLSTPELESLYTQSLECFYHAFSDMGINLENKNIPFGDGSLSCIILKSPEEKHKLIFCTDAWSYAEEFVAFLDPLVSEGFTVYLCDAPGQGSSFLKGLYSNENSDKYISSLLDYFKITSCIVCGYVVGCYWSSRAASYDDRIKQLILINPIFDYVPLVRDITTPFIRLFMPIHRLLHLNPFSFENSKKTKRNYALYAINNRFRIVKNIPTMMAYIDDISTYSLKDICPKIKQDVLLMSASYTYINSESSLYRQDKAMIHAKSVTKFLFNPKRLSADDPETGCTVEPRGLILQWLKEKL